jgi:hypothetical protein
MAEGFITRKGGVSSEQTAAPTITVVEESDKLIFTLTNNDDNTALITYQIDNIIKTIELAASATSSQITIDTLDADTYTLTAFATVVGEVATKSDEAVEIVVIPEYELIADVNVTIATTQIDFDNLNITKDDELRLVYTFTGKNNSFLLIRVNDITTNYFRQNIGGTNTTLFAGRAEDNRIAATLTTGLPAGFVDIKISNNDRFVAQSHCIIRIGSDSSQINNEVFNVINTSTVTSITKLSILSTISNGIAVGSRLTLYKVNTGVA